MDVGKLLMKASDDLSVRRAFGTAYEKDDMLIIPVALVAGGGGAGMGHPRRRDLAAGPGFGRSRPPGRVRSLAVPVWFIPHPVRLLVCCRPRPGPALQVTVLPLPAVRQGIRRAGFRQAQVLGQPWAGHAARGTRNVLGTARGEDEASACGLFPPPSARAGSGNNGQVGNDR